MFIIQPLRTINITSNFMEDQDGWVGLFSRGQEYPLLWKEGEVYLLPLTEEDTGFYKAPEKFLGSHLHSYGQPLFITFTSETTELLPRQITLVLEGSGLTLTADLSPHPAVDLRPGLTPRSLFSVRLHEHETRFRPSLSSFNFQLLLNNLTAFKISNAGGQNYTAQLAEVILTSAFISTGAESPPAPWVEFCSCPVGFMGQFCEQCSPGFTREQPGRGPLSPCVPCNCHHHGTCHPETGIRCQMCEDGFYGDPLGQSGHVRPCTRCDCNNNVDFNALGICDHVTGKCLKCLGHTEGDHCERCKQGFYGDALNQTVSQKCRPCRCNPGGTFGLVNECHPQTGDCLCLSHVTGRDCSSCEVGFFNLQPGLGCERCKCNPIGSSSFACHPVTGQCLCRAGVEGSLCETCARVFLDSPHVAAEAEKLQTQVQDLEKLLAQFDCKGRSGRQPHLLKYHRSRLYGHEHQGEDTLPNALEDFLAFQEAREAFIKQFASLESSTGELSAQLHGLAVTLNCTDVIPFEMPSGPNKWNVMVNESQWLMESHKEAADHIEAIASSALQASKQTFTLLMDLLMDNSTEEYIKNLTKQIAQMQQWKEALEVQVNETAAAQRALEEEAKDWSSALGNITSSLHQLALASVNASAQPDQTHSTTHFKAIAPAIQARAQEAKLTALSSVVSAKEVESEAIALHRGLECESSPPSPSFFSPNSFVHLNISAKIELSERKDKQSNLPLALPFLDMVKEWPRQQLQTKAVLKKERPLRDKVLAEVKRKVAQLEEMLKPALENSSDAANVSNAAEQIAQSVAKESKSLLSQAKHTRTASTHLGSHINAAVRKLNAQEETLSQRMTLKYSLSLKCR
ncbi:hypothetical protein WMY93_021427 [Mugilogobius chulae]|uniref:Laminin subunit gamma-3 n=1 Tax=Mugilogobius chulae TaxID=88201 RepID=A0AAW0NL77_9GOBI